METLWHLSLGVTLMTNTAFGFYIFLPSSLFLLLSPSFSSLFLPPLVGVVVYLSFPIILLPFLCFLFFFLLSSFYIFFPLSFVFLLLSHPPFPLSSSLTHAFSPLRISLPISFLLSPPASVSLSFLPYFLLPNLFSLSCPLSSFPLSFSSVLYHFFSSFLST